MYAVEVRDRIMIAHSLPDPFFGPAQHMHGATFVVDVAFFRETLTKQNVVVDIGAALDVLNKTLEPLAYQNLDALPQFKGRLTTTEFLCRHVFDAIVVAARSGALGDDGKGLAKSASPCTRRTWPAPPSKGRYERAHGAHLKHQPCHPGRGWQPDAGTQGQELRALLATLGPGYFAAAKFRDDGAAARLAERRHDLRRLRHSRRHQPAHRRLHLRPPRHGAVAAVWRGRGSSGAAG